MAITELEAIPYEAPSRSWAQAQTSTGQFIAVDGEGMTDSEGKHHYILLAASNGAHLHRDGEPIRTWDCLNFLCELPQKDIKVGFAFSYDVNMILRDLPFATLKMMHEGRTVQFQGFVIHYLPRRRLSITRKATGDKCIVYDVFGFFQASFVNTLRTWNVGTPEERERIAQMKGQRGSFRADQMPEILAYCLDECRLLVATMDRLKASLDGLELTIRNWWGAGAVAASILGKENAKAYIPEPPTGAVARYLLCAYFGGRFDTVMIGNLKLAWGYDIRSAYPSIMRRLPCMKHGKWQRVGIYEPNQIALWRVQWETKYEDAWTPFPVRLEDQRIFYPSKGKGIYWGSEVDAAVALFGDAIKVSGGYVWRQECDHSPFEWIETYYQRRLEYKQQGLQEQLPLKLGINSLYGKMAQSIGYQGKRPTFQSWEYAGQITAGTRAQILRAILAAKQQYGRMNVVRSIATDGIVCDRRLALDFGEDLGQWEASFNVDFWLYQGGVYECLNPDTLAPYRRNRGFVQNEVDWEAMKRAYIEGMPQSLADIKRIRMANDAPWAYRYNATRFLTLGAALLMGDEFRNQWGQWIERERKINFMPALRFPYPEPDGDWMTLYPVSTELPDIIPYEPKQDWDDIWNPEIGGAIWTLLDLEQP